MKEKKVKATIPPLRHKPISVRALFRTQRRWCKGSMAKDGYGVEVNAQDKKAVSFCLYGAVNRIYGSQLQRDDMANKALDRLRVVIKKLYHKSTIVMFNDAKKTTFLDVMRVLKEAKV